MESDWLSGNSLWVQSYFLLTIYINIAFLSGSHGWSYEVELPGTLLLSNTINTLIWATQFPYLEKHREYPRQAQGISGIVWEISYDQIILPFIPCSKRTVWRWSRRPQSGEEAKLLIHKSRGSGKAHFEFLSDLSLFSRNLPISVFSRQERDRDTNFHGILARTFLVGLLPISASLLWLV